MTVINLNSKKGGINEYCCCKYGNLEHFAAFAENMENAGKENGVDIRVMHEDIFNTMHRI